MFVVYGKIQFQNQPDFARNQNLLLSEDETDSQPKYFHR